MPGDADFHHLHKAIHKTGSYHIYICDSRSITIDYWILIGRSTFYGHPEHSVIFARVQVVYCAK